MRFSELLATEGVEERCELRSRVGIMAFHGGNLERATAEIAEVAATRSGASIYSVTQPYPLRIHVSSAKIVREDSVLLARFLDHVDTVIALHGYGREGLWTTMLVGGSNRVLASALASHLRCHCPEFVTEDDLGAIPGDLRGLHATNPVNVARNGGVQLELPPRIRGLTPHAATMQRTDGFIAWTHELIDALVATVESFERFSGD